MKFICVQPRLIYYAWQLEVMLNNFIKIGIKSEDIEILLVGEENKDLFSKLENRFSNIKFFTYKDTRIRHNYISSIRPNILKQHYQNFPNLEKESVFYHDCDIVFTNRIEWNKFVYGNKWYLSNTSGYIGSKYILEKKRNIFEGMCDIVGIDRKIPKLLESNSGGAQYLLKNVDYKFWNKVEEDCEKIYDFLSTKEYKEDNYHPIQKWTSDMWALLWNAWYFEHETIVDKDFEFSWATDQNEKWSKLSLYHNAGVVNSDDKDLFYKGDYINKLPYDIKLEQYSPKYCSYNYVNEIIETAKNTCLKD